MRIYPRDELARQRAAAIAKVIEIIESVGEREQQPQGTSQKYRNTAADARVLRMIPVVAEGVAGASPGTNPLQAYIESEQRANRHSPSGASANI